jgi:CubicO group peptidase (beta-lactamase class C family)
MKIPRYFSLLILAALSMTNLGASEPQQPLAPSRISSLTPALQSLVDSQIIPGAVAFVADKERVLDFQAVGYFSLGTKEPMRTDNVFWIASMTKSMTATALMMLVDDGKVNVNDPVEKYLPEFKGQMVPETSDPDRRHPPRHPITIKEILSHTSGIVVPNDPAIKRTYSLKDNVAQYAAAPLRREPGTKYEYNNACINTAGRIIEVVSGIPYADFMQRRLFDPLGMKDTTFWPTEDQARRLARSARRAADKTSLEDVQQDKGLPQAVIEKQLSQGKEIKVPASILADMGGGMIPDYVHRYAEPAGGLFSTAHDVGTFCQMLLNGGMFQGKRFLSLQSIREMTAIQTDGIPVNPQEAYGLGWSIKIRDDEGLSVGSFGHRGARRPVMWVDPKNELVMVLLVERFDCTGEEQKQLYGSFLKAAIAQYGRTGR